MAAYKPSPPLGHFVDLLWHAEDPGGGGLERALPTGTVELVFRLSEASLRMPGDERTYRGAVLSGAHSQPFLLDRSQQDCLLGVHFHPGGAFPFLGCPADELEDARVGLEDLWGPAASELRDRLAELSTVPARFALLERELTRRLAQTARHPVVAFALQALHGGGVPMQRLVDKSGYSQRRFIQLFRNEVGMTPKGYDRVRRFQRVLERIPSEGAVDWAEIALSAGYYDQAHFGHDFRAFSGLAPRAYLEKRTGHQNHLQI